MGKPFPDLKVTHRRIKKTEKLQWNLTPMAYQGFGKFNSGTNFYLDNIKTLHLVEHRLKWLVELKEYCEGQIDTGVSVRTVWTKINLIKAFIRFCDENNLSIEDKSNIQNAFYKYGESLFLQEQRKELKRGTGYNYCIRIVSIINSITERNTLDLAFTRLKRYQTAPRATSRGADKTNLENATKLASFAFDICCNFNPALLKANRLPITVRVRKELLPYEVNLTSEFKHERRVSGGFESTQARSAFNYRVAFESLIFFAMTEQNIRQTHNLRISEFDLKPMGEKYEVREYKNRRGGEVLFRIPKIYRERFEIYLEFIREYSPDCPYLFPFIDKTTHFRERQDKDWGTLKALLVRNGIPPVSPRNFRKLGLNIFIRLCANEQTVADFANHTKKMFRENYEIPSQQRAIVEITRFWDTNDPLIHGEPKLSLFNTPCVGTPAPIEDGNAQLAKPDCLTPTGCINCQYYRDEDSQDYVWNLYSFRYLKIIESSSYLSETEKPSNIAIDWLNSKINWFKDSEREEHSEWVEEACMRIDEGAYHPNWDRKIKKCEG